MKHNVITCSLLALAAMGPAFGTSISFTDRGTWAAQVTSLVNYDSGVMAASPLNNFNTSAGLALTDLQIVGFNDTFAIPYELTRVSDSTTYYNWGTGTTLRTADKTATNQVYARITFTNAVSAFGFNFGLGGCQTYSLNCYPGAAGSVTIKPNGQDTSLLGLGTSGSVTTTAGPTFAFFGVVSDSQVFSFVDIVISDTGRYLALDNIAYGNYSAPPPPPAETAEPGTLIQLAMGFGLLGMAKNRFSASANQTA